MDITVNSYAKINLMLDITGKLPDGYHTLFMLMQSVGLYDEIEVSVCEGDGITLTCSRTDIPCDSKNTAYKAAMAFLEHTENKKSVSINIIKNIPHEAGLAGGSADAAAVIRALNTLLETRLSARELIEIGMCVGSDVPFCIFGGTCLVQHSGSVISPLPNLSEKNCTFVLCKPENGVSTASAYSLYDSAEGIRHLDRKGMLNAAAHGDTAAVLAKCDNVFEQVIDVPERAGIKGIMRSFGADACCMSGSGPTIYAAFTSEIQAEKCAEALKSTYPSTFVAPPVPLGVAYRQVAQNP